MKLPFDGCVLKEYPVGSITQYFGENPDLYKPFGLIAHNGIDLVAKHGTPLVAVEKGVILHVKEDAGGYGKHIRLLGAPDENGVCNLWSYGHMDTITVAIGDKVSAGDIVGTMGNTGFVVSGQTPFWSFNPHAGTHLHLGLRRAKRDPNGWTYVGSKIKITVFNAGDGYKGSVDPLPLFGVIPQEDKREETQLAIIETLKKVVGLYKELIKTKK